MAAATMYVTPAGAGDFSGSTWANAMGYTQWETDVEATAEAGDIYYVAGGTYTLTSDFITLLDGTAIAPIKIIGVNSGTTNEPPVYSDWATGTNRPLITDGASAYSFEFDDYWVVKNIRMTGSDTYCIKADISGVIENCKSENDGTATRYAFMLGSNNCTLINSEAVSTNGIGVYYSSFAYALYNYIHDSATGLNFETKDSCVALFNVIDTCLVGINADNAAIGNIVAHNTIYNDSKDDVGSIGIDAGTGCYGWTVIDNIITGFATGINFADTSSNAGHFDYNDIYDCTTDRVNAPVGNYDIDVDPGFVDAANGNFAITGAV